MSVYHVASAAELLYDIVGKFPVGHTLIHELVEVRAMVGYGEVADLVDDDRLDRRHRELGEMETKRHHTRSPAAGTPTRTSILDRPGHPTLPYLSEPLVEEAVDDGTKLSREKFEEEPFLDREVEVVSKSGVESIGVEGEGGAFLRVYDDRERLRRAEEVDLVAGLERDDIGECRIAAREDEVHILANEIGDHSIREAVGSMDDRRQVRIKPKVDTLHIPALDDDLEAVDVDRVLAGVGRAEVSQLIGDPVPLLAEESQDTAGVCVGRSGDTDRVIHIDADADNLDVRSALDKDLVSLESDSLGKRKK